MAAWNKGKRVGQKKRSNWKTFVAFEFGWSLRNGYLNWRCLTLPSIANSEHVTCVT